jgi:RNA recognition motif-containing protein
MIKLFIVGYPLDIQESELIEIFSIHGMLHSISLLTDRTGKAKGYGFVEMMDQAGAERAIAALSGMVLRGRKITVKVADEDRERKAKTYKENHFPVQADRTGSSVVGEKKDRRPRKLVSHTFRAEE